MKQKGAFTHPLELDLYRDGKPVWIEYKRETGIDLAAIPVAVPEGAHLVTVQDVAQVEGKALEPGMDVIVIGYPFEQGKDFPYPI
jgi:hypothetical protein